MPPEDEPSRSPERPSFAIEETVEAPSGPAAQALAETVGSTSDASIRVPDERVDRYVLRKRLGAGGMGIVYQATDSELGRDVAIKMMKGSGASADRLKREAQALARLDHPNVVSVFDVGVHDGRVFVAMELVDGSNLHDWLQQADRSTDEILRVLYEAANGILAAHAAGMIHRDLKPDNIFIAKDGRVLVGDFGLARDADDDDDKGFDSLSPGPAMSLTQTGHVLGTPAYMAPEQAEGEATERSDQFSFCVTAYEALYGTRPFPGSTFQEILDRVDSGSIEAPRRRRKLPGNITRAIRRGLDADPAQRFDSMGALIAAMRQPKRRLWPWLAGGGALAAAATTVLLLAGGDRRASSCDAVASTETVWNTARRGKLVTHLLGRTFTQEAATEIAKELDDYAVRWSAHRREACVADASGTLEPRISTARSLCHALALAAFEQTLRAFEQETDADVLATAKRVSSLPPIEGCASDDVLKLAVPNAEHDQMMRELTASERTTDLASFAPLRARAEAANDLAAQLEIALVEARRALELGSYATTEAALQRGMPLAEQLDASGARARLLALAAEARCAQNKDPENLLPMAEAAGKRLDPIRNALELSAILQARAACLVRRPDPAPAVPVLEELIAQIEKRDAMDLDEVGPRADLALVYRRLGRPDDAAKQEAIVTQILSRYTTDTSVLGHQAFTRSNEAFLAGDLHGAIAHQQRGLQLMTQPLHQAQALGTLAMYYDVLADFKASVETYTRLIEILATLPRSDFNDQILVDALAFGGWARLHLGAHDDAFPDFEQALPLAQKFDKPELLAVAQMGLGRVWLARKEYARAVRFLQDGLATHARLGDAAQFRVAIGLFALAQALWELGDKFSARTTAEKAEAAVAKGLDQAREHPLGAFGIPFKQTKADEIARWRETHK